MMMTVKCSNNMFSSVATTVATASFDANNFGTAVAVPFFVLISIICIISITCGVALISALLITLISILLIQYNNGYESKREKAVI